MSNEDFIHRVSLMTSNGRRSDFEFSKLKDAILKFLRPNTANLILSAIFMSGNTRLCYSKSIGDWMVTAVGLFQAGSMHFYRFNTEEDSTRFVRLLIDSGYMEDNIVFEISRYQARMVRDIKKIGQYSCENKTWSYLKEAA